MNWNKEHNCPAYNKVIDPDLCYESMMVLCVAIKPQALPEIKEIVNLEQARKKCLKCPYSDQTQGMI